MLSVMESVGRIAPQVQNENETGKVARAAGNEGRGDVKERKSANGTVSRWRAKTIFRSQLEGISRHKWEVLASCNSQGSLTVALLAFHRPHQYLCRPMYLINSPANFLLPLRGLIDHHWLLMKEVLDLRQTIMGMPGNRSQTSPGSDRSNRP